MQGGQNMRRSDGAWFVRHQSAEGVLIVPGIGGTLGKKIGQEAAPGEVICLYGDLGVGKTVFTKGLADGLGITEPIQSPTFTIVREYEEGRLPLYHFDVYRIGDIEEMDEIGYEDYVYGEGVCLIEWANLIEEILPDHYKKVTIRKDLEKGFDYREIEMEEE